MPGKYKAKRCVYDGIKFASLRERDRYIQLKLLERAGEIRDLTLQPSIKFSIEGRPVLSRSERYPNGRQVYYRADFRYVDVKTGETCWEDSKGARTEVFRLKKAMVEAMLPHVKIIEV